MLEVLVLATTALGIGTGLAFVVMMFMYFHSGPLRLGDQVMSTTMLLGGMCQFVGFCMGVGGSITCDVISMGIFALSNAMFWSARVAHGANRPAAVLEASFRRWWCGVDRIDLYDIRFTRPTSCTSSGWLWQAIGGGNMSSHSSSLCSTIRQLVRKND